MKLKQLLGGVLAAALVVTSMPTAGLIAYAAGGQEGPAPGVSNTPYVYQRLTSTDQWKVATDAGNEDSLKNILTYESSWTSGEATSGEAAEDNKPYKSTELVANNNIYLKLSSPSTVGKLLYYNSSRRRNGKILQANVYALTTEKIAGKSIDINDTDAMKALDWGDAVASDKTPRNEGEASGGYYSAQYLYKFNEVVNNTEYIRIEVLRTCGDSVAIPDSMITGHEVELYSTNTVPAGFDENGNVTDASTKDGRNPLTDKSDKVEISGINTDFPCHGANPAGKLIDGSTNNGDANGSEPTIMESMYFNELQDRYLEYPLQKGFIKNNNIYISIPEGKNLGMLTYVPSALDGSVLDATIYVSNAEGNAEDIQTVSGDATTDREKDDWTTELSNGWVKVYNGAYQWAKYSESVALNNGHSIYWEPMMAKHVRIEVEHTYGVVSNAASHRNVRINAKRVIVYEAIKDKDITRQNEVEESVPATKVVAFSGYPSNPSDSSNKVDNMFDGTDAEPQKDTAWELAPAKGDGSAVPYIVLDLGENTRTLLNSYTFTWDKVNYATKYAVLTTDKLNAVTDITQAEPNEENNWSGMVLNNPPHLNEDGSTDPDDVVADGWKIVRTKKNNAPGQDAAGSTFDDKGSFNGASPDNSYFDTAQSEELKRYVCLAITEVNPAANGIVKIYDGSFRGVKRVVTPIDSVKLEITAPHANQAPQPLVRDMTDPKYTLTSVEWYNDGVAVPDGFTFPSADEMENHRYAVKATLKPDAKYIFTENSKVTHEGDVEDTRANGHYQTLMDDDTLEVYHVFQKKITSAVVNATLPNAGTNVEEYEAPTTTETIGGSVHGTDLQYTVEKYEWYKDDEAFTTGQFEKGQPYELRVTLVANGRCYFAENAEITTHTIAEKEATISENPEDGRRLTLTYPYTIPEEITVVQPTVVRPKNAVPAKDVAAEEGDKYTVTTTQWKEAGGELQNSSAITFNEAKAYTVEATLAPQAGYAFAENVEAWLVEDANKYKAEVAKEGENIKLTYNFAAENSSDAVKEGLTSALTECALSEDENVYTSDTLNAYKTAKSAVESLSSNSEGKDANEIKAAIDALKAAFGALKKKITLPTLTVDAPVAKGEQSMVAKAGDTGVASVETKWYKEKEASKYEAMAVGETFAKGKYKLAVTLVPEEGYAFETETVSASLTNLAVTGSEEGKAITPSITLKGNVVFTCEFDAVIPCDCQIGKITVKVDETDTQTIDMGTEDSKTVQLSATARTLRSACEIPEHKSDSADAAFTYAEESDEQNIATVSETGEVTVTGAGSFSVKVTAVIRKGTANEKTKEEIFTYTVTSKDALKALKKAVTDAEVKKDDAATYTKKSREALDSVLTEVKVVSENSGAEEPAITEASTKLQTAVNALKKIVAKPQVSVAGPVWNESPENVTSNDQEAHYEVTETKWYKTGTSDTEVPEGSKFEAGTYKLSVTLTANTGYGFEADEANTSKPDSIAVTGENAPSPDEFMVAVDSDETTMTITCKFTVVIPCTCEITDITVKAGGADYIDMGDASSQTVDLTATAKVNCQDPDHAGRTAEVVEFKITPDIEGNVATEVKNDSGAWKLTVNGIGTAAVTVTMKITQDPTKTVTKAVTFQVRSVASILADLNGLINEATTEKEKTDTYTAKSLAALETAIGAAQDVVKGEDHSKDTLLNAESSLQAAMDALKKKIAKPSLSVAKPVFDAAPADVTKKAANDNYTVTTEWSKVDGQTVTKLNPGDKFGEGTYRATVTLTPAKGYAFEDGTKPDSIAVNDGTKDETKTVVATLDEVAGSVTFTCDFTVTATQAECTCAIENVSLKIDGEDTGVIYLNLKSTKTVALTAAVTVGEAKCAAHPDAAATYTIAKKTDQSNIIQEIKQSSDSYSMTVKAADPENKGGEWAATVTVTATLSGKTKTKDVTFKVTREDPSDSEAWYGDLDGKVSDEVLNGNLNPGFADDARTNYLAEAEKKNHTDKTLQMLEDAIAQGHAVRENTDATTGDVLSAADFFGDVENAAEQEKKLADLKAEIEALDSTEYTAESWSAFQATLTAKNGEIEALQSDWTAENSQMTVEVYAAQMESLKEALTAAKQALVKKGTTPPEDPDLAAAKEAVSNALAAAQDAYENADNQSRTDKAWTDFKAAYEAAKNAAADANAETLNGLAEALNAALQTLNNTPVNPPVDPEIEEAEKALQKALKDMQDILGAGQSNYSDETWEAFRQAYLKARDHAPGMTAEELKNLLRELNEAKAALAENKQPTDEKKPQPNQGGQKPPTGDNLPKAGTQYTVGKLVYQVKTSTATDKTVMVMNATSKTQKKITIPATVTIGGQAYKVVEIKANAFAKNKKLTTVTIGKNVTKIGKKAFLGCAKLKKVTIKAAGLKTIGKQAFAKINKKAKIKVPKKQLKTLKKKLKKAKTIKSAKITK